MISKEEGNHNATAATTILKLVITALDHEIFDDAVERDALVAMLDVATDACRGERGKVSGRPWCHVRVQLEDHAAQLRALLLDVKKDLCVYITL